MSNRNLSYMLIVLQSFAFFVALSVFLGRIYFITYYERLGIPTTETTLTLIDYTVISPDVTILGIGNASLLTIHILMLVLVYRSGDSIVPATWHYGRIGTGIFLIIISVLLSIPDQDTFLATYPEIARSGLLGLWSLLRISLILLAGYFIMLGVPLAKLFSFIYSRSFRPRNFLQTRPKNGNQYRGADGESDTVHIQPVVTTLLVPILFFVVLILWQMFFITSGSARFGRMDADIALQEAAQVDIEFNAPLDGNLVSQGANQCNTDINVCRFELILVGERFIFVKSIVSESSSEPATTYALPINDLAQIAYVPRTKGN